MEKKKRQKFIEGSFIEINLKKSKKVYARLLPSYQLCVYGYQVSSHEKFVLEEVIDNPILFYVGVYKSVITEGYFEIVGFKNLVQRELEKIPPVFTQSEPRIEKCNLIFNDGKVEKVDPHKCIGLEKASAYSDLNIIDRIEHHYAGKKYVSYERSKVILTRDDPRYMNPNIRWSYKEEKFYKL